MWAYSALPKQNKKAQLAVAAIMIVLLARYLIVTGHNAPDKKSVNGVYHNDCCSDVILKDGYLTYGASTVSVDLENMKFGLTGYVDGQFTRSGIEKSNEQSAIDFSEARTRHVIYMSVDGRTTSFETARQR